MTIYNVDFKITKGVRTIYRDTIEVSTEHPIDSVEFLSDLRKAVKEKFEVRSTELVQVVKIK